MADNGSMLKFFLGLIVGMGLSIAYVHWGFELPRGLALPNTLRDNIVSSAIEDQLYDLEAPSDARKRALEIFFQSRSRFAAEVDTAAGSPFLKTLQRQRAGREAREIVAQWEAADKVLAQPALRAALERKHNTRDTAALKEAMLAEALAGRAFLANWLSSQHQDHSKPALLEQLRSAARLELVEPEMRP